MMFRFMKKCPFIIFLLWIFFGVAGCGNSSDQTINQTVDAPKMNSSQASNLEVHFIDVGQGDSILIICDQEAMLIDAGDNNQGTKIQNYIKKRGIEQLRYVIGTHPDADHIGGMDVILYKFDCETVIMPEKENDTATYRDVIDVMNQKMYKQMYPTAGQQYTLGSAVFTILSPDMEYEETNNCSVIVYLQHGENTFLFSGDAEELAEQNLLQKGFSIQADVLKVGHHGSKSSSSGSYLDAISPEYAVISCGEGNTYGHPHAETLNNLRTRGIRLFRTDEQGSIVATSDGKTITWNCAPTETWQAGEYTTSSLSPEAQPDSTAVTYILNINTKKFHYLNCRSVSQMSEKNKKQVMLNRQEVIDMGYEPCQNCKP